MRACWLVAALWLGALLPSAATAQGARAAQGATPAAAPAPMQLRQHVTDLTGTLTSAESSQLESELAALEQRKGAQLALLIVPSTGELPIEQYALAVAEKTKLGRKAPDDGLLLVVAKDDRKARIEVGYGLEGVVTDAIASRVIREYLAPKFRANDYYGGLQDAVAMLVKLVDGEPLPPPMAPEQGGDAQSPWLFAAFVGVFIGIFAGGTRLRPVLLRRVGAGGVAAAVAMLLLGLGAAGILSAIVAFLLSGGGGGRFGSGRGHWGSFPGMGGGWGGGGFGGGGGWSGGGGGFGGGGASGNW